MSAFSENSAYWSDSTPTLPDIEKQPPLTLFQAPYGYDGDVSVDTFAGPEEPTVERVESTGPRQYVVAEAVQDPGSTEVPEAIPIVEQVPVGIGVVEETPVISEGECANASSSESSSSVSTTRPVDPAPAADISRKSSVTFAQGEQTLSRKSTTYVIKVPAKSHSDPEVSLTRRRSTTIKVVIEPGQSSEEHSAPVRKTSPPLITVLPEKPVLVTPPDNHLAAPLHPILKNKTDESIMSKQSKRARVRAMWRRLIAKIMEMKAKRAAKAAAREAAKDRPTF